MKKPTDAPPTNTMLEIETLEDRVMLSTVSILASGSTGEETMNLVVNDRVVQTWENVATEQQAYTYQSEGDLSPEDVQISFTNDLYLPDQGIDRNLTVESMSIDGVVYATDDPGVLSTGVWNPQSGAIETGFGQGSTLHANGEFVFPSADPLVEIDFGGVLWNVVDGVATRDNLFLDELGDLTLGGAGGPLAISTQIDAVGGEQYLLTLNARREFISGPVTQNGPWSTVGINFYDADSQLIRQELIEINSQSGVAGDSPVRAPEATTSAFLWAWIDDYNDPNDTFIPLKISEVDWRLDETVGPDDTTPPQASMQSFTFTDFGANSINFGVDFSDDQELAPIRFGTVYVDGPDGPYGFPEIATGVPGNTESFQTLVFTMPAPFGQWQERDNGVYTVRLVADELSDVAGNFANSRVLGTITVDIETPDDTTPPNVELASSPGVITSNPNGGRGSDIEFVVNYTDDVGLGDLAQDRILVEGPNGYSGFGRGIAGGSAEPNGFFEITYIPLPADGFWSSNENGSYTISLVDGAVVDEFENFTPGRELGTFEIRIPGEEITGGEIG